MASDSYLRFDDDDDDDNDDDNDDMIMMVARWSENIRTTIFIRVASLLQCQ